MNRTAELYAELYDLSTWRPGVHWPDTLPHLLEQNGLHHQFRQCENGTIASSFCQHQPADIAVLVNPNRFYSNNTPVRRCGMCTVATAGMDTYPFHFAQYK
jgi:hypothetical protein